jgi:hypothetical protein
MTGAPLLGLTLGQKKRRDLFEGVYYYTREDRETRYKHIEMIPIKKGLTYCMLSLFLIKNLWKT